LKCLEAKEVIEYMQKIIEELLFHFNSGKILHPKIIKQVIQRIKNSE